MARSSAVRVVLTLCALTSSVVLCAPQIALGLIPPQSGIHPQARQRPDGSTISVSTDGLVTIKTRQGKSGQLLLPIQGSGKTTADKSDNLDFLLPRVLAGRKQGAFRLGEVIVVFRQGYSASMLTSLLSSKTVISSAVVGDAKLADTLREARAKSLTPLFGRLSPARLSAISTSAQTRLRSNVTSLSQAYVLKVSAQSPLVVAKKLMQSSLVKYAEPNYIVSSMLAQQVRYPSHAQAKAVSQAQKLRFARRMTSAVNPPGAVLPTNYALTSSLSSFLNANALDWTPAYEVLEQKYSQLPGQGEIITNVSIGDLTDQSQNDGYIHDIGPTSVLIGNQRYLDAPSLPLIPTYVADENSNLDPAGTVEGSGDAVDGEIYLDFSVMAPLPHDLQRAAREGEGLTDLLGVAPGAQYRLVVPQQATFSNIAAALIGASQQQPAPNVITASIGFGTDGQGFPGRYLEEEPMMQSIIASIVQQGIVVCISSNDGTRLYTNTAVGPDGGSTPTNVQSGTAAPTTIADTYLSTTPGVVPDSGAIDVGGTTLDDVFSVDPTSTGPLAHETAFAETRYNGATMFSSGFGSRVNVSAPSDGIPSMVHAPCLDSPACSYSDVFPVLEGGTSASAPEVAAAAAVVLQAARLSGKTLTPDDVRSLLASTGRRVPTQPQVDQSLNVGPQVDIGAAVTSMLAGARPGVARVAIAERQPFATDGAAFEENTDPSYLDLNGPYDKYFDPLKTNTVNPITIAPDWIGMPSDATFSLFVTGHPDKPLATTRWTRLVPSNILGAAGMTIASPMQRTVSLTYRASEGHHVLNEATIELTFSASDGLSTQAPPPIAPADVLSGQPVTVSYDISHVQGISSPAILVSNISHWSSAVAPYYRVMYKQRLLSLKGTVTIPATAFVGGGGMYGLSIDSGSNVLGASRRSTTIRVKGISDNRPPAPMLATGAGGAGGHFLAVPRAAPSFSVSYDITSVPNANGAMLELSAPGPNLYNSINNFNNPFGTAKDDDGYDSGSAIYQPLSGTKGTVQLDALKLGLGSSVYYNVRIVPVNGITATGQASAVSTLTVSDTSAPGGQYVTGFDIVPGGTSSVSTIDFAGGDSSLFGYEPQSEIYGAQLFSSTNGLVTVFGSDRSLNQAATSLMSFVDGSTTVQTIDEANGTVVGTVLTPTGATVLDTTMDAQHHRLAMIEGDSQGTTSLIPYDLNLKVTGNPLPLGDWQFSPAGPPKHLNVDTSSGTFYAWSMGNVELCQPGSIIAVKTDTATVGSPTTIGQCDTVIASDNEGKQLYALEGWPYGLFHQPMSTSVARIDAQSLAFNSNTGISGNGAIVEAVDATNNVLLVGYLGSANGRFDNTGAGVLCVYNLSSGQLLKQIRSANFTWSIFGYANVIRGIQIDPTTRTGWTYSGDGTAIQQFGY